MLSLILLAILGVSYDVMGPVTVSYAALNEQCFNLGCQCKDCSGAECRCGTSAKIPAAIPLISNLATSQVNPASSPVELTGFRQVRVCGPNGCSTQMVPTEGAWTTTSSSTGSGVSSCPTGTCGGSGATGVGESRQANERRIFRVFRGGGRFLFRGRGCKGGNCQ